MMALDEGYGFPLAPGARPRGGIGTPLFVPPRGGGPANGPLLMALLQALGGGAGPRGEPREYGPMRTHAGEPWGMDTDPADAMVLRNLLALRNPEDFPGAPYPIPNAQAVAEPSPIPNFRPTGRQVPVPLGEERPGLLDRLGNWLTGDGFGPPPPEPLPPLSPTGTSTVKASTFLGRMKQRRQQERMPDWLAAALGNAAVPYRLDRNE